MSSPAASKRRWPWAIAILVLALVATGLWFALRKKEPAFGPPVAEAVIADIEDVVLATGTVKPFKLVLVGAQVTGQVKALHVKVGDRVKEGQLLAEIDAVEQRSEVQRERNALGSQRAQRAARAVALTQAELALKRQQTMMAEDATPKAELQSAEAALANARADLAMQDAEIRRIEISIQAAEAKLAFTRITAPMDGVVVSVVTEQGQTLNAMQAAPTLVKLAQIDPVQVETQISEADVSRVRVGMPAWFTLVGDPNTRHETKVSVIDMVPQDFGGRDGAGGGGGGAQGGSAVYYNALLTTPNPEGQLRIAMTAKVNIVVQSVKNAITIPSAALGAPMGDGRYMVRVLPAVAGKDAAPPSAQEAKQAKERTIRVGLNNRMNAQVLEGLKAGERVLLQGMPAGPGGPGAMGEEE